MQDRRLILTPEDDEIYKSTVEPLLRGHSDERPPL